MEKEKAEIVFPAHAGMNRGLQIVQTSDLCVPRSRGDEPQQYGDEIFSSACSPLTRG